MFQKTGTKEIKRTWSWIAKRIVPYHWFNMIYHLINKSIKQVEPYHLDSILTTGLWVLMGNGYRQAWSAPSQGWCSNVAWSLVVVMERLWVDSCCHVTCVSSGQIDGAPRRRWFQQCNSQASWRGRHWGQGGACRRLRTPSPGVCLSSETLNKTCKFKLSMFLFLRIQVV